MSALVFDVHASIHFQEVRSALVRIPEVIQKIREVQKVLDRKGIALDLGNFIASDDSAFLHHYRRKEFAGVVLQLGLYERFLRFFEKPTQFVGVVNSISALRVITGQITLEQFVEEAFKKSKNVEPDALPGLPVLSGIQIPKYQLLTEKEDGSFEAETEALADINLPLKKVSASSVYEVGLGSESRSGTIDLDPHLSWVWDQVKDSKEISLAN